MVEAPRRLISAEKRPEDETPVRPQLLADFVHAGSGRDHTPKLAKAAEDAVLALVGLGYAQAQAAAAVARISAQLGPAAETAALIRAGLKELAQ